MSKHLRIAIAQLDFTVGDIPGNLDKHLRAAETAKTTFQADIIVFPELSLCGYPPDDLLKRPAFIAASDQALLQIQEKVKDIYCVVGHPHQTTAGLQNACSLIYNGRILARYAKQHLPNYGVFDEARYFIPGTTGSVITIKGVPVGITICEDLWFPGPIMQAANLGARIILSPNASPFEIDKHRQRENLLKKRAQTANTAIVYANCVGAQDDLVFDGGSMVVDETGQICEHAGFFHENLLVTDIEVTASKTVISPSPFKLPTDIENIYQCLVLGLRDYVEKNQFPGALIGVSGGIDSALTLAIAVDALGKDKVHAVVMPSRYTAQMSLDDANELIQNLGVSCDTISIEPTFTSFLTSLAPAFTGTKPDVTEENIQARCRGVIIMALSNKTGRIVLTTGNRSELAVGYATLYGDMAGGFAVLKDVPKTLVYALSAYRNQLSQVIPERIITRAPTAELAPDQKDEDSLPPYSTLDKILASYLDAEQSTEEIIANGFDRETVLKVIKMIKRNEYKRKQAPIGTRINHKAFGRDRRYPNTNGYTD